jgi:hypothetical protein
MLNPPFKVWTCLCSSGGSQGVPIYSISYDGPPSISLRIIISVHAVILLSIHNVDIELDDFGRVCVAFRDNKPLLALLRHPTKEKQRAATRSSLDGK